jgi:hypothetical protein
MGNKKKKKEKEKALWFDGDRSHRSPPVTFLHRDVHRSSDDT